MRLADSSRLLLAGALSALLVACNTVGPMELSRPEPAETEAPVSVAEEAETQQRATDALFGDSEYKTIAFKGAISAIRHGTTVLHFPSAGLDEIDSSLCNRTRIDVNTYEWRASNKWLGGWNTEVGKMIYTTLTNGGFDVAGNPDALFEVEEDFSRTDYLLGARLTEMKGNVCQKHHWWDGRPLDKYSAETTLAIDWILYDPVRKRSVKVVETEGYGIQKDPKSTGIEDAFYDAWADAANKLAMDPDFAEALVKRDDDPGKRAVPLDDEIIRIEAIPLRDQPLKEYMADILDATVTIRRGQSIGSGYLVSSEGYVLTNQHVVGGVDTVLVVFRNGIEVTGEVIRRHERRDVALIKIPITGGSPFPLDFELPQVTDDVYAIGNPLYESLRSTVTKGVVSAHRKWQESGLRMIQADVDIQGGNSGGPLVNDKGNVVGMSVAGLGMTPEKKSVGLNLFIPIADALAFLNIEVEGRGAAGS